MEEKKFVFVLGAGSSFEAGMPMGEELITRIHNSLVITKNSHNDYALADRRLNAIALKALIPEDAPPPAYNELDAAAIAIKDGMALSASIDVFLGQGSPSSMVTKLAKLAIAWHILKAERSSLLGPVEGLTDLWRVRNTWYRLFFNCLVADASRNDFERRLRNTVVISFNYDRTLEIFLLKAIRSYFGGNEDSALNTFKNLVVIHPYGHLGDVHGAPSAGVVEFGDFDSDARVIAAGSRIRVFSEDIPDNETSSHCRSVLEWANHVVFLGSAYHAANLRFLGLGWGLPSSQKREEILVHGTALNESPIDTANFRCDVEQLLRCPPGKGVLDSTATCTGLFAKYRTVISYVR